MTYYQTEEELDMYINFENYDLNEFTIIDGYYGGVPASLIIPNEIGVKFTQTNKIFRSSIWSKQGELLSASFPKFTNFGENPENFPVPSTLLNTNILDKIDGSTHIFDFIKIRCSLEFSITLMEKPRSRLPIKVRHIIKRS